MPITPYDTIKAQAEDSFIERKSRFIGAIRPVGSESEAQAFIAERRAELSDASHNCYAYIIRDNNILRYSDDGEPQGTAGLPILEVIRREGLWNIAVVVTRYFGGILLGAGGLIRAYSHAAKLAVDAAKRVTMCPCALFMLECPYPLYERVKLLLAEHGGVTLGVDFGADITFDIRIRSESLPPFAAALTELSNGTLEPVIVGEEFAAV
jgi:uncharacterized YigZ family protein